MQYFKKFKIFSVLSFLMLVPVLAHADDASSSSDSQKSWIDEKFGGLTLTAGPAATGGFGAALKGEGRQSWLTAPAEGSGCHVPVSSYVGYATDDSWNTKAGSMNQASVDLRPGLDFGVFCGAWDFVPVAQISSECRTNPQTGCPLSGHPKLEANFGFYGDLRYRYGTFQIAGAPSNVNQLLGGAGAYFVLPIIAEDRSWFGIDIWPRASVTYYTSISNDTSAALVALPAGIKADFIQSEFKFALNLGPQGAFGAKGYPFRFTVTYDGSQPTTGTSRTWQSLWNLQLSTDIMGGTTFKPAITYQSGTNGGLKYDQQILIGFVTQLF